MRTLTLKMMSAVLALGVAGVAAAMAPASGTIKYRATATYSDGTSADRLYAVALDADSDGDGIGDEGWLRVRCSDGAVAAAFEYDVKAPRDVATGQASGKRMHKPFTITKEWGASSPMLGKTGGGKVDPAKLHWDLATMKGNRTAGSGPTRGDHSGASDDSAGKGADKASVATYDVKKVEGSGARSGQWDQMTNKGAKTMAHDSWTTIVLTEGSPNLCS